MGKTTKTRRRSSHTNSSATVEQHDQLHDESLDGHDQTHQETTFTKMLEMQQVVCMRGKRGTYSAMLKDRDYDVTAHIFLILSLTLTQNARGGGR